MIHNMAGGGGAGLNFKIIGGTSKPSSPGTNTLWVNTSAEITGYVFSATQPSGSEGLIWIQIGTSSTVPFNVVKKNAIYVYPKSVKQYIDGEWESREAHLYNGTSWVQFSSELYYLFDSGDVTSLTGGWTRSTDTYGKCSTSVGSTLKISASAPSAAATAGGSLTMNNSITGISDFTYLCISWTGCSYSAGDTSDGRGAPYYEIFVNGTSKVKAYASPSGTTKIDISSLTKLKLGFHVAVNYYQGGSITLNADRIWLE